MAEQVADEKAILKNLLNCRQNEKYCDVKLLVNGKRFNCHRVVLAATSGYFDSLFNSLFEESKAPEIPLTGISHELIHHILLYMYTGNITLSLNNVYDLLKTSDYLVMTELKERCISFIERKPQVENLLHICVFAFSPAGNLKLATASAKHAGLYFQKITKMKEFVELEFVVLECILKQIPNSSPSCSCCQRIVNTNHYCGNCGVYSHGSASNEPILSKVCDWIMYDVVKRLEYFPKLVKYAKIDLKVAEKWEIMILEYKSHMRPSMKMDLFVTQSVHLYALTENRRLVNFLWDNNDDVWLLCEQFEVPFNYLKGLAIGENEYFLSNKLAENDSIVTQFWTSKKQSQWSELRSPPIFGKEYATASISNSIYLYVSDENPIRSYNTWSFVDNTMETEFGNIYTFVPDWNQWFVIPPIPQFLYNSYFISVKDKLFVIGGSTKEGAKQNILQYFDSSSRNWSQKSVNVRLTLGGSVCSFGNKIFICEEPYTKDGVKNRTVYVYDIDSENWQIDLKTNASSTRALVPFNDRLWAIPQHPSEKIEIYDPKLKMWNEIDNIPSSVTIDDVEHKVAILLDALTF